MPAPRPATTSTRSGSSEGRRRAGPAGPGRGEGGAGLVSAWAGFLVFLALLLLAVQVLTNLYATSVVTSVAADAARRVAAAQGDPAAQQEAEAAARQHLGRYGSRVSFDWSGSDDDVVVLRARAQNPSVLLPSLSGPMPFGDVDRTVRVRVERFR